MQSQTTTSELRTRVGLLLDDPLVPGWIHETIQQLLRLDHVELVVIIYSARSRQRRPQPRSTLFALWRKLDRRTFAPDSGMEELRTDSVSTLGLTLLDETGQCKLSHAECDQMRQYNLDVLVQLGSADLGDEFLSCARYGVWAFDYGEHTEVDGELALFWNLNASRSIYEVILRAATGNPRREWLLCRRAFASHLFSLEYNATLDRRRRTQMLLQRLSDLHRQGWDKVVIEELRRNGSEERIDSMSLNRATVTWLSRSLRRLFMRILFREQWILAYSKSSSRVDIEPETSDPPTILVPPRGQNYADPFLFEHEGKTYIFFEQYDDNSPGTICCAELHSHGGMGETQRVLSRPYHLSYPFVFEWQGEIYLLPETWDNGTLEVYRAIDFPLRWEPAAVLLRNVFAVDATILEYHGKLWLFAAGLAGLGTEFSELSIFFADSLFGEWHPHPKNPIVRDVRRARPAGRLFYQGERLIRPGQDCSQSYGYAISFNRVDILSETEYSETPLTRILPTWIPRLRGTHTFNQHGDLRVLDGLVLAPRWLPMKWNWNSGCCRMLWDSAM